MNRQVLSIFIAGAVVFTSLNLPVVQAAGNHAGRSQRFRNAHQDTASAKTATKKPADATSVPDALFDQLRVLKGFKIAPVQLNMDGKDAALVGLGSYLVNAGGCNDCHTNPSYLPGGDPYKGLPPQVNTQGYLGGGQKFGPFTSRNLTPEPNSGNLPAGMAFDEFLHVMRTGEDTDMVHPQISPLLQVMPWPSLGQLTDHELRAIYEYLSAIPPVSVPQQ